MAAARTPVFCVEDNVPSTALVRTWIERAPGLEYVGDASTIAGALSACRRLKPRVIVLDVALKDGDSIDRMEDFHGLPGAPRIVLHTSWTHDAFLVRFGTDDVHGLVWKSSDKTELLAAIACVAAGRPYFSAEYYDRRMQLRASPKTFDKRLSRVELDVLRLTGRGKSDDEICREMQFAKATLDTHRRDIRRKLNIHDPQEMRRWCHERGFDFMG